jgi:hypothetical protein
LTFGHARVTERDPGRSATRGVARGVQSGSAAIGSDGRFVFPSLRLRKVADNTFTVTVQAQPSAARKVLFSALCLDCLAAFASS